MKSVADAVALVVPMFGYDYPQANAAVPTRASKLTVTFCGPDGPVTESDEHAARAIADAARVNAAENEARVMR
jgi:hypothetical protein